MRTGLPTVDWGIVARTVHVLSVVVWIGGVWLVTTVLLPAMRDDAPEKWIEQFDTIERRFGPQARVSALIVLLSGPTCCTRIIFGTALHRPTIGGCMPYHHSIVARGSEIARRWII